MSKFNAMFDYDDKPIDERVKDLKIIMNKKGERFTGLWELYTDNISRTIAFRHWIVKNWYAIKHKFLPKDLQAHFKIWEKQEHAKGLTYFKNLYSVYLKNNHLKIDEFEEAMNKYFMRELDTYVDIFDIIEGTEGFYSSSDFGELKYIPLPSKIILGICMNQHLKKDGTPDKRYKELPIPLSNYMGR